MAAGGRRWARVFAGLLAGLVVFPVAVAAGAAAGFWGALRWLGDEAPAETPATSEPAFHISAAELDAMLEATPDPPAAAISEPGASGDPGPSGATPPAPPEEVEAPPEPVPPHAEPFDAPPADAPPADAPPADAPPADAPPLEASEDRGRRVMDRVRSHKAITEDDVDGLGCEALTWARAWLFGVHGYPFTSPDARAWFAARSGYDRQPDLTLDEVEASLTPEDRANRGRLNKALKAAGCPCPGDDPKAPCPP